MPSSISSRLRSRSRPRGARSSAISKFLMIKGICGLAAYGCGLHRMFRCRGQFPATPGTTCAGRNVARRGDESPRLQALELQAAFARRIGERLDATVVAIAGTVEGNLLDAGGLGLGSDRMANLDGGFGVLAVLQAFLDVGLQGRGRSQDLGTVGGEDLGVQV